jgi:hypothetical protein
VECEIIKASNWWPAVGEGRGKREDLSENVGRECKERVTAHVCVF